MAKETRSPEALALFYLRAARGWTQKELAAALGPADEKRLCRYEKGDPALPLGGSPASLAVFYGGASGTADVLVDVNGYFR